MYNDEQIVFLYICQLKVQLKTFEKDYKEQTRRWKMKRKFKFTTFPFDLIFLNELSLQIQAFLKINNMKYINNTNKFRLGQ